MTCQLLKSGVTGQTECESQAIARAALLDLKLAPSPYQPASLPVELPAPVPFEKLAAELPAADATTYVAELASSDDIKSRIELAQPDERAELPVVYTKQATGLGGQLVPPSGLQKPVVVPQTTKAFDGAPYSPFVRAYSNSLAEFGVTETEFLKFIDGLNDSFIVDDPLLNLTNTIGCKLGLELKPYSWLTTASLTTQALGDLAGIKTRVHSKTRVSDYMGQYNTSTLHPKGLHGDLCATAEMTRKVGFPSETVHLMPLADTTEVDVKETLKQKRNSGELLPSDPRQRRIQALEGYVAPITFDVSKAARPNSYYGQLSAKQVTRLTDQGLDKISKQRTEAAKWHLWRQEEARKESEKWDKQIRKIEKQQFEITNKAVHRSRKKKEEKEQKKLQKTEEEVAKLEKERLELLDEKAKKLELISNTMMENLDKLDEKENKEAQKILWIVITSLTPGTSQVAELPAVDTSLHEDVDPGLAELQ